MRSPALPLARVDSKAESHLDTMASGEDTFLTETAPPVLQNLGREMSWIDATAEAAMLLDLGVGCDELIEKGLTRWIEGSYTLSWDSGADIDVTIAMHHTSRRRLLADECSLAVIAYGIERRRAVVLVMF